MPTPDYPLNREDGAKALHTGFDFIEYTNFSAELDLTELDPTGANTPARIVCVLEAAPGTVLECVTQQGNTRTLSGPRVVGLPVVCGVRKITVNTTVASVLVIW